MRSKNDRRSVGTSGELFGFITMRPLCGATCAPLRWFSRISEEFKKKGWSQCRSDPRVFRFGSSQKLISLAALHVDDILVACEHSPWSVFHVVADQFRHTGLNLIESSSASCMYLGLDLSVSPGCFVLSQDSF